LRGEEYEGRHIVSRVGAAGSIELWPLVTASQPPPLPLWQPPELATLEDAPKQRLASALALKIAGLIGTEMLESQGRLIEAGDILVLVRSRQDQVDLLVRALKGLNVPVAGSDRMVIADQLPVQDVMAVIRMALLPEDDLTLAALLRSPLVDLTEDQLFDLAATREAGRPLIQALMARASEPAYQVAAARIRQWRADADRMPPFEFLSLVLGRDRGRALLAQRLGASALDPVDELMSEALRFEAAEPPSLQGFVRWIEGSKRDIKRESDTGLRNEVRIMTVHGAKGLQAPIVVLADAGSDPNPGRNRQTLFWDQGFGPIWSPSAAAADDRSRTLHEAAGARRLQEHNRLLYVALTRAEDRLIIAGCAPARSAPGVWWDQIAPAMTALGADSIDGAVAGLPGVLQIITRSQRVPVSRPPAASPTESAAALPDFAQRPPRPEPARPKPLSPSEPLAPPPRASPGRTGTQALSALRRGRLTHTLLQVLPSVPEADRADAAARLLAQPVHGLDPASQAVLAAEVLAVLADPTFAAIFAAGSQAEVPIVGRVGRHTVAGRIDRLAVSATHVLVVDIKTDRPPPATVDRVAPAYLGQLALYHALLAELYPTRTVEAALLWTNGPRLMPIPPALLASHLPG
jgi:ATP-dependent helicase/nuclease subunit A